MYFNLLHMKIYIDHSFAEIIIEGKECKDDMIWNLSPISKDQKFWICLNSFCRSALS